MNCKEYNDPSTVYYSEAIKIEEYGKKVFDKARKVIEHKKDVFYLNILIE